MKTVKERAPEWITFLRASECGIKWKNPPFPETLDDPETYVHHTAGSRMSTDPVVAMKALQEFSYGRNYSTVAYDVVVHRNTVTNHITVMGAREGWRSAATKDRNEEGEAICLMGYFHPGHSLSQRPTDREVEGLAWGIAWMIENGWSDEDTKILGHRDNPEHPGATTCPGEYLYQQLGGINLMVAAILAPAPEPTPEPPTTPTYPAGADMIHPVAKFRNSDTRHYGVPLNPNQDHEFGLDPAKVPANAVAVALNVAVVPAGTAGWLDIRPAGSPFQGTSTVNYEAAGAHNGATVVGVTAGKFTVRTSAPAHVIVDVTGFWTL